MSDPRRLKPTSTPGIFKRVSVDPDGREVEHGYVATFRDHRGKQHKKVAKTLAEAKRLRSIAQTDDHRGELFEESREKLIPYLKRWVESYQGNGARGFRENTRAEYRRLLE